MLCESLLKVGLSSENDICRLCESLLKVGLSSENDICRLCESLLKVGLSSEKNQGVKFVCFYNLLWL